MQKVQFVSRTDGFELWKRAAQRHCVQFDSSRVNCAPAFVAQDRLYDILKT